MNDQILEIQRLYKWNLNVFAVCLCALIGLIALSITRDSGSLSIVAQIADLIAGVGVIAVVGVFVCGYKVLLLRKKLKEIESNPQDVSPVLENDNRMGGIVIIALAVLLVVFTFMLPSTERLLSYVTIPMAIILAILGWKQIRKSYP